MQKLLDQGNCDPATILANKWGSSALHVAAHHGHGEVLTLLLEVVYVLHRGRFDITQHKNTIGESPADIIYRRCEEYPGEARKLRNILGKFNAVITASAGETANSEASDGLHRRDADDALQQNKTYQPGRTYNKNFAYAVCISPLVGNRFNPFDWDEFRLEDVICGLEDEWRRFVKSPADSAYQTWSYMRQDMLEDWFREVPEEGVDK